VARKAGLKSGPCTTSGDSEAAREAEEEIAKSARSAAGMAPARMGVADKGDAAKDESAESACAMAAA